MSVLLRRTEPASTDDVGFLRDRCSQLQRALSADHRASKEEEDRGGDILRRWTQLLVPRQPWSPTAQKALEDLYVLHAKVEERIARGGVADISHEIDALVRALLVDNLQRATDRAVDAIS